MQAETLLAELEASLVNAQILAELHNDIQFDGEESSASGKSGSEDTGQEIPDRKMEGAEKNEIGNMGKEIFETKKDGAENNEDDGDNEMFVYSEEDEDTLGNFEEGEDGDNLGNFMEGVGEDGDTNTFG